MAVDIHFIDHGFYGGINYGPGQVEEIITVDDNFAAYTIGMGHAVEVEILRAAKEDKKK